MFDFDPTVTLPLLVSVAAMAFAWFRTRRHDVDERFDAGRKKMTDLEQRMSAAEMSLLALPGKDDMHQLQLMLTEMAGDMKATRATMRALGESVARQEGIVSRHEDHMRENK